MRRGRRTDRGASRGSRQQPPLRRDRVGRVARSTDEATLSPRRTRRAPADRLGCFGKNDGVRSGASSVRGVSAGLPRASSSCIARLHGVSVFRSASQRMPAALGTKHTPRRGDDNGGGFWPSSESAVACEHAEIRSTDHRSSRRSADKKTKRFRCFQSMVLTTRHWRFKMRAAKRDDSAVVAVIVRDSSGSIARAGAAPDQAVHRTYDLILLSSASRGFARRACAPAGHLNPCRSSRYADFGVALGSAPMSESVLCPGHSATGRRLPSSQPSSLEPFRFSRLDALSRRSPVTRDALVQFPETT